MRGPVFRLKLNDAQKFPIRVVPISEPFAALGALVEGHDVTLIELQGTRVGNLRFGIFAFLKIGVALSNKLLLANIGIPRAGRQDERDKKKKADSGSQDITGHSRAWHKFRADSIEQYRHD